MSGRLRSSLLLHGLVLVMLLAGAAEGAMSPIAVSVREPDGIPRAHWPLTFSVPLARGALSAGASLVVRDETGGALPVQTRPLSRWPDGSVRWLQVDTQVDLRARQTRGLRVEAGTPPPPQS